METLKPEAEAVANLVKALHNPQLVSLPSGDQVAIIPEGMAVKSLKPLMDEYRVRPERRAGQATLLSLDSLIAWTNRHKGEASVLFADPDQANPRLLAVIDYNDAGAEEPEGIDNGDVRARFGRHRGAYAFPLSKPWKTWAAADGRTMSQLDFATFLEDNIGDVAPPPVNGATDADAKLLETLGAFGAKPTSPSSLLKLSKGLEVTESARYKNQVNLDTGEVRLVYETEHRDENGQSVTVPNAFIIRIPVFENTTVAYRIPVRLRYRKSGDRLTWTLVRYRPELCFEHAFTEAVTKAQAETGLPLFLGRPEGKAGE